MFFLFTEEASDIVWLSRNWQNCSAIAKVKKEIGPVQTNEEECSRLDHCLSPACKK